MALPHEMTGRCQNAPIISRSTPLWTLNRPPCYLPHLDHGSALQDPQEAQSKPAARMGTGMVTPAPYPTLLPSGQAPVFSLFICGMISRLQLIQLSNVHFYKVNWYYQNLAEVSRYELTGPKAAESGGSAHCVGSEHPKPYPGSSMWLWISYLISLRVRFLICEMG